MKISKAVDDLLVEYGVQPLMVRAEYLQADLKVLQNTMDYIRSHNQPVSQSISELVGKFSAIYDLIVPELEKVCTTQMGPEIAALCDSLKVNRLFN